MKIDLVTFIIVIIMVLCLAVAGFIYYEKKVNTCTSNPLVYASNLYSKQLGYEFVGTGFFITPFNIKSPQITFNSTKVSIT